MVLVELSKGKTVDIKELSFTAKCTDMFMANLYDKDGNQVGGDYDGYVPSIMPEVGNDDAYDYVELEIDIETGVIKNWKKPSASALKKFLKETKTD